MRQLYGTNTQRAALDFAFTEALECLHGHAALDCHVSLEVEDGDLDDLRARDACGTRQGAENIAGAQFIFASSTDAQSNHRRLQRRAAPVFQAAQRMPVERRSLQGLDGLGTMAFGWRDQ